MFLVVTHNSTLNQSIPASEPYLRRIFLPDTRELWKAPGCNLGNPSKTPETISRLRIWPGTLLRMSTVIFKGVG